MIVFLFYYIYTSDILKFPLTKVNEKTKNETHIEIVSEKDINFKYVAHTINFACTQNKTPSNTDLYPTITKELIKGKLDDLNYINENIDFELPLNLSGKQEDLSKMEFKNSNLNISFANSTFNRDDLYKAVKLYRQRINSFKIKIMNIVKKYYLKKEMTKEYFLNNLQIQNKEKNISYFENQYINFESYINMNNDLNLEKNDLDVLKGEKELKNTSPEIDKLNFDNRKNLNFTYSENTGDFPENEHFKSTFRENLQIQDMLKKNNSMKNKKPKKNFLRKLSKNDQIKQHKILESTDNTCVSFSINMINESLKIKPTNRFTLKEESIGKYVKNEQFFDISDAHKTSSNFTHREYKTQSCQILNAVPNSTSVKILLDDQSKINNNEQLVSSKSIDEVNCQHIKNFVNDKSSKKVYSVCDCTFENLKITVQNLDKMILAFSIFNIDIRYDRNNIKSFINKQIYLRKFIREVLSKNDINLYRQYYLCIFKIFPKSSVLLKYLVQVYFDLIKLRRLFKTLDDRLQDNINICKKII